MVINEKLAYSPQECSMALGLCLNSVYKLIKQGKLKSVKPDRKILIPRYEIDRLLNTQQSPPPTGTQAPSK